MSARNVMPDDCLALCYHRGKHWRSEKNLADINVKLFLQRDEFQSAANCPEVLSGNWMAGTKRNRAILPTQSNRNHRALPCCKKA
jgi:hypothetical protein